MPAPATTQQFLELLQRSNLVPADRLQAFLGEASIAVEDTPQDLAASLIGNGLLTHFQSEQLLLGKWRGFSIGKYRVLERLGSGGMGAVYLCEHQVMHRKVAIKVLPISKAEDPSALGRFYREARAAGSIDHPNLVKAHDIDQDGEMHYLVMDYVDGINLQQLINRFGPLPYLRTAHYIAQAAAGLQYAHEAGLVHRDIKPANLMLDRSGTLRVLDLGLARFYQDNQDLLTLRFDDKSVLGTADYVSPEQALNSHGVDTRTDIYSLGATFYFLLCGHPPFPEGKVGQKLIWHQTRQPRSVCEIKRDVPVELEAVVMRMMAKNPNERYQTFNEVIADLEPWTRAPIAPPDPEELPELSPAARASRSDVATATPTPGLKRVSSQGTMRRPTPGVPTPQRMAPQPARGKASRTAPAAALPEAIPAESVPLRKSGQGVTPRREEEQPPEPMPAPVRPAPPPAPPRRSAVPEPLFPHMQDSVSEFDLANAPMAIPVYPNRGRMRRLMVALLVIVLGASAGVGLRWAFSRPPATQNATPR
jgi:serine/threonine protein kinase